MTAFLASLILVSSFLSSLFTADVAADALWNDLPQLMVQEKSRLLCCNNVSWRLVILIRKVPFYCLELRVEKKGGKREHHVGASTSPFLDCFGGFSHSFLDCSSKFHIMAADVSLGLSGPAWVLGLINGLRPLPLIFCCHRSLGSICFEPSK
jgi:hypothetical protein